MLDVKRLELALERIKGEDWHRFERYASAFFVSEFPSIRTMASPSGDEGRDAEIFQPEGSTTVALQYSVTAKWGAKIRHTVKRLEEAGRKPVMLIYSTNVLIGAEADALKAEILTSHGVVLDVRDRNYFLERYHLDASREALSEELAKIFVDPLLEKKGIIDRKAQALTPGESRAALVFLELQWEDDTRDKGLTKIAYEALVRAVLRDTDLNNRMPLAELYKRVSELVPDHDVAHVTNEVDKAIRRLDKTAIRAYQNDATYCLTNEEVLRIRSRLTELEVADEALGWEIANTIALVSGDSSPLTERPEDSQAVARATIERFLMERGELFVAAIETGQASIVTADNIRTIASAELASSIPEVVKTLGVVDAMARSVEHLLGRPTERVATYLRSLSDAYTLRAFLRQTPDVQEAVKKMFSVGEIWLDTSLLLPLFGEALLGGQDRVFQKLISSANNAGLALRVTPGVIEEVERHMHRADICARTPGPSWQGSIPYLLSLYVSRGFDPRYFNEWLTTFRGDARPEDDVAEYLQRKFKIVSTDISADASRAAEDLRFCVQRAWQDIHLERRSRYGGEGSEMMAMRLASHDVDNYLGVMMRRNLEGSGAFGYTSWWLTLDQKAFTLIRKVEGHILGKHQSPVMSADFLANYLAVGPLRGRVANSSDTIPVSLDATLMAGISTELFELAREIRRKNENQPEEIIQRKIRDGLDEAKRRTGEVHDRGLTQPYIEEL